MSAMVNSQPLFPPPAKKLGLPFCLHLLTIPQVSTYAGEVGLLPLGAGVWIFVRVVGNVLLP